MNAVSISRNLRESEGPLVSLPLRFILAFVVPLVAGLPLAGEASARDYKLGCVGGDCVIVDDTGRVSFFNAGDKKLVEGADQLKASDTVRIRPPLNVACGASATGAACVITDADGHIWIGPPRAGAAYGDPIARIPVPVPGAR
jgi:hypothetical protein